MRKWKRWLVLTLTAVLCLALCGCDELETMRAEHGLWQEDGSILWNGAVYRNVDVPQDLDGIYGYGVVNVTEPDVPVLLSAWFGEEYNVSKDGVLLYQYDWDGHRTFYCREDQYNEMSQYLNKQEQTMQYYYYEYYDENDDWSTYFLTEEESDAVNQVVLGVMPRPVSEYEDEPILYSLNLWPCDEKHLFSESKCLQVWVLEDGYLLVPDTIEGYEQAYVVPQYYKDVFDGIVKTYYDADVARFE